MKDIKFCLMISVSDVINLDSDYEKYVKGR